MKKTLVLLLALLLGNPLALGISEGQKFNPDEFGCYLAGGFQKTGMDYHKLQAKRKELETFSNELSSVMKKKGLGISTSSDWKERIVVKFLRPQITVNYSNMALFLSSREHSIVELKDFYFYSYFAAFEKFKKTTPSLIDDPLLLEKIEAEEEQSERRYREYLKGIERYRHRIDLGGVQENVHIHPAFGYMPNPVVAPLLSPLARWLLQQEKESVSIRQLYNKSLELYEDSWMAVSAIAALFFFENIVISPRNKHAVLSSKIKRIVDEDNKDPYGALYHFWNYISLSMQGKSPLYLKTLSFGHEVVKPWANGQKADLWDWQIDRKAIVAGRSLSYGVKNPYWCDSVTY